jgi:hypothetical protein
LYALLERLDSAKIHYTLSRVREDTVMVEVHVPGRHYEIEAFTDGSVEVEIYKSDGHIGGQELIEELFRDFSD